MREREGVVGRKCLFSLTLCYLVCTYSPFVLLSPNSSLALVKKTAVMRVFIVSAVQCMHSRPARIMLHKQPQCAPFLCLFSC
jgi:hypothetical protein